MAHLLNNIGLLCVGSMLTTSHDRIKDSSARNAELTLRTALALADSDTAWIGLGHAYSALGNENKAWNAWTESEPAVNYFLAQGRLAHARNDLSGALLWFERAVSLGPRSADGWFGLGIVQEQQGDLRSSLHSYERAIEVYNDQQIPPSSMHFRLGRILYWTGNYAEALTHLEYAVSQEDWSDGWEEIETHFHIGEILRKTSRFREAAANYQWVLKNASPEHWTVYWAYVHSGSLLYKHLRVTDLAEQYLETAIRIRPEQSAAYHHLGSLYLSQNRVDDAREVYQRLLSVDPEDEQAISNLEAMRD